MWLILFRRCFAQHSKGLLYGMDSYPKRKEENTMAQHQEGGEAVRSIRDWGWMTSKEDDDGNLSISYGDAGTKGHYVENSKGETTYSRDTEGHHLVGPK